MTIWRISIACYMTKITHAQYAILIAFPLQQRLQERASALRYTYISCVARKEIIAFMKDKFEARKCSIKIL